MGRNADATPPATARAVDDAAMRARKAKKAENSRRYLERRATETAEERQQRVAERAAETQRRAADREAEKQKRAAERVVARAAKRHEREEERAAKKAAAGEAMLAAARADKERRDAAELGSLAKLPRLRALTTAAFLPEFQGKFRIGRNTKIIGLLHGERGDTGTIIRKKQKVAKALEEKEA